MVCAGIWASDKQMLWAIESCIETLLPPVKLIHGAHPSELSGVPLDVLIITPDAEGWEDAGALGCRTMLIPDGAGTRGAMVHAGSAVSYGACAKDTLTLSSMEGAQLCLAIQRELVTVYGAIVGQQELVLTYPAGWTPDSFLCAVGALLLLGVPAEEIRLLAAPEKARSVPAWRKKKMKKFGTNV